jgi:hypothetical protein
MEPPFESVLAQEFAWGGGAADAERGLAINGAEAVAGNIVDEIRVGSPLPLNVIAFEHPVKGSLIGVVDFSGLHILEMRIDVIFTSHVIPPYRIRFGVRTLFVITDGE